MHSCIPGRCSSWMPLVWFISRLLVISFPSKKCSSQMYSLLCSWCCMPDGIWLPSKLGAKWETVSSNEFNGYWNGNACQRHAGVKCKVPNVLNTVIQNNRPQVSATQKAMFTNGANKSVNVDFFQWYAGLECPWCNNLQIWRECNIPKKSTIYKTSFAQLCDCVCIGKINHL